MTRFGISFGYILIGLAGGSLLAAEDTQHGETVVASNQGGLDAPIRRHPKALWYELENLRKETGRPSVFSGEIALDFRRDTTAPGWHDIVMVVKSKNGRREFRSIGPSPFAKDQGTVQGRSWFGVFDDRLGDTLEVWLEQHQNIGGKSVRMKVSKSITLGNVGQLTYAREWTPEEAKAFQDWEKSTTPPPAPPAGYELVSAGTSLLPGMPVLAGWMGAWQPAEVIDIREGSLLVKYREVTASLISRPRNWIAVDSKTLEAGRTNPAQFRASVKVLPGGSTPVPADLLPVDADTPLVKGATVKAEWASRWSDVTVIDVRPDGKIRIHWDGYGSNWDEDRERKTLLITPAMLATLKKPDAAEQLAKKAEKLDTGAFGGAGGFGGFGDQPFAARRHLHPYPIRLPIPKTAVRVTDETPLVEGTKLGCCWGNTWHNVTVLEVHDDLAVKIRWDLHGSAWDGDIARECLIIDKGVLAKLEAKAKKPSALKPAGPSDASAGGDRFKVVLKSFGTAKIAVTKAVVDATGLDLKDAKDYVDSVPVTLKQNLTKEAAEKLRQQLQDAGGTVAIELQ